MDAIAPDHPADGLWRDIAAQVERRMKERGADASRTVVLLPYVQLIPVARRAWTVRAPQGFMPRFETTRSWAAAASAFEPAELDFTGEAARDLLTARALLARAGLEARADALAPRVAEAAAQLAPLAAATQPAHRGGWAAKARCAVAQGMELSALDLEAAIARLAIEWVAASSYETDALLDAATFAGIDQLVVVRGLQEEPLHVALLQAGGEKVAVLDLVAQAPRGAIALHAAADASDEAERAAACVLRHIEAGRVPVALAATDRVGTRRTAALLRLAGVPLRDEQGWKLSTTRSAAHVMVLLEACAWDAGTDQVLDWLKHAPAASRGALQGLERRLRRAGLREWRSVREGDCGESEALRALLARTNAWREQLAQPRSLPEWLAALREVLQSTGQLASLAQDEAGMQVMAALRLDEGAQVELNGLQQARARMTLGDLRAWVEEVLEADSFRLRPAGDCAVTILPFWQALARPFAAIVLPGCDEQRLPASPDPPGAWTSGQRRMLGLPSREQLHAVQLAAWQQALQVPHCDVLWRGSDDNGEALLASPLVQSLVLEGAPLAPDPRATRSQDARPVAAPQADGSRVPVEALSASAYEDLRRCPYRFFALRQLGLKEAEEVESEVDKRDFGNWLHSVLRGFHESLHEDGEPADGRAALLDRMAAEALAALRVDEGEFLPFHAGWKGVRDAYLEWLQEHEAAGARFEAAEARREARVAGVRLHGYIDRIDRLADGMRLVIDYKTESDKKTKDRVRDATEDTQLAFYAALLGDDTLRAAYLNVSERGIVTLVRNDDVLAARELLLDGIASELSRISAGATMPALGEGVACDFCAARGLCRKDAWS